MADSRDMVIIHRVFRREFALLPDLVRGTGPGDTARSGVLIGHARLLVDVLHHHHDGEDLLLWPKLRSRAVGLAALLDRMDDDHARLADQVEALSHAVDEWADGASADDGERVAVAVEALARLLVTHLDAEEEEILPHVDAHLSDEEWGELGQRAFSLLAPDDALTVLGAMAEECPPDDWAWFETHLPPPVVAAHRGHAPAYRDYVRTVRQLEPA